MKKIITSAALILTSAFVFAQENYTVKMNMKIEGLPPEYAGFGEQETVTYIKGEKTKTEVSSMMMNQVMVFDGKMHTFLSEAMGNKTGYTVSKEELDAATKDKKEAKPKIEYTNEKKTIAGYECTKAVVTSLDKDKKESVITVWVTDKIKYDMSKKQKTGGNNMMLDLGDIKGYPLEMQLARSQQGMDMKITITATDVSTKPIDDSVFVVSTEGYTMSTYKETMDKVKNMKGGGN